MKVNAFVQFPETDEAFALLHADPKLYDEVITDLLLIKKELKAVEEFRIFYDTANLNRFLEAAKGYVEDKYITGIKNQLQYIFRFVGLDVNSPTFRDINFIYALWDISIKVELSSFILSESAECKLNDDDNWKTICIILQRSTVSTREQVHIIKDKVDDFEMPCIIPVEAVESIIGIKRWLTLQPAGKFNLRTNPEFIPTSKFWKREKIYLHVPTGNYWYFDYFHKDNKVHYEVFDNSGEIHLGEANSDGELDTSKASDKKKITFINH